MQSIDIRIDLGAIELVVHGQTIAGTGRVKMSVDRATLAALIAGAPMPAPVAEPQGESLIRGRTVPVEVQVAIDDIEVVEAPVAPPVIETDKRKGPQRALAHIPDDELRRRILSDTLVEVSKHYGVSSNTVFLEKKRLGLVQSQAYRSARRVKSSVTGKSTAGNEPAYVPGPTHLPRAQRQPVDRRVEADDDRPDLTDVSDNDLRAVLVSDRPWDSIAADYGVDRQRINKEARRLNIANRQEVVRSFADITFRTAPAVAAG